MRHQLFRIGGINPQRAAAQGYAENLWNISEPDKRGHYRFDLDLEQFRAKTRFQVSWRRFGEETSALDKSYFRATLGFVHVMGRDEDGFAGVAEVVEQVPNLLSMDRVEAGRWLIEKKQRRIVHERATEREQLAHSARQTSGGRVAFLFEIAQPQQSCDARFQFSRRHTAGPAEKAKIFFNGQIGIKTEPLRDVTEFRPDKMSIFPDIVAGDGGASARRMG